MRQVSWKAICQVQRASSLRPTPQLRILVAVLLRRLLHLTPTAFRPAAVCLCAVFGLGTYVPMPTVFAPPLTLSSRVWACGSIRGPSDRPTELSDLLAVQITMFQFQRRVCLPCLAFQIFLFSCFSTCFHLRLKIVVGDTAGFYITLHKIVFRVPKITKDR